LPGKKTNFHNINTLRFANCQFLPIFIEI